VPISKNSVRFDRVINTFPTSIRSLIQAQAKLRPSAVYAVTAEPSATASNQITYSDLQEFCGNIEATLQHYGLAAGDTVSVIMPNGLMTLRLLLGTMYAGMTINPVNLLSQADQMQYVLEHSDCKLIFANGEWVQKLVPIVANLSRLVKVVCVEADADDLGVEDRKHQEHQQHQAANPLASTAALLMYTSGTTGQPKGVVLTHGNLLANAQAISNEHQLTEKDRVHGVLPFYHINAFTVVMLTPLFHGGSIAVAPKFSSARYWHQVVTSQCTWVNVVPTIISYLLEGETPAASLSAVRFCRSASAALPPEHLLAFEKKFGLGIIETMGLTETAAPSFSNPLNAAQRKVGAVGKASGCEALVVDAQLTPVADGATGEIVIRGAHVMLGYYKNAEATKATFTENSWLRTGDLGHRDSDGFFFVTGRIKELIIKGGENIAPREIDEALLKHPAILEAAAVGIPDKHYGQEILACIVLRDGQVKDEAELRRFCEANLGRYKTPKEFRFVESLPRGPSGKVQRLKLLS
jgi:long-chain acyl-CoA synthetase